MTETSYPRSIRSFVLRAGRMGSGQARALAELGPKFILPYQATQVDLEAVFGRCAPKIVEIGFGMGQATAAIADCRRESDFLGIEVHEPGVGALLKRVAELDLSNIRVIQHDAVEVFKHMLADASLGGIHIFFPDPWHKKRHHKRRLIQADFVSLLTSKLKPGGYLHLATDWQDYAQHMLDVLSAHPGLINSTDGYAKRPDYRPVTKFELRGLKLGHGVWDLLFRRRTDC